MARTRRSICAGKDRDNCTRSNECRYITSTKRSDYCRIRGVRRAATPRAPSAPPAAFASPALDTVLETLETQIPQTMPGKVTMRKTRKNGTVVSMSSNTVDAVIAAELKDPDRELTVNPNGTITMSKPALRPAPRPAAAELNDVRNSHRVFRARIGKPTVVDPAKIKGVNDESAA
jgi:hypothetical protein